MAVEYFSPFYKGEIANSGIARYAKHVHNSSIRSTTVDIFGENHLNAQAVLDLPSRIDLLLQRTPLGRCYTANELIGNHTLFFFFTAFAGLNKRNLVFDLMKGTDGRNIKLVLGLLGHSPYVDDALRYCPGCIMADLNTYGEVFWHLIHQIPGTLVCTKHKLYLRKACPICGQGFTGSPNEFIGLELDCPNGHALCLDGRQAPMHRKEFGYAQDVEVLFQAKPCFEPYQLFLIYKQAAAEQGLLTKSNFLRIEELITRFLGFYDSQYLSSLGADVSYAKANWLIRQFRKPAAQVHPTKHLLLIRFLFGSIRAFLAKNPVASSDFESVRKHSPVRSQSAKVISEEKRQECRNVLLATMNGAQSQMTRADIRRTIEKEYTWLLRNDFEWLESVLPEPTAQFAKIKRPGYTTVDNALAQLVTETARKIKELPGKPVRASRRKIISLSPELKGLRDRLSKLPLTATALEENAERTEDVQIRRIKWAAYDLTLKGIPLTESYLKFHASIWKAITPQLREVIREIMNGNSS